MSAEQINGGSLEPGVVRNSEGRIIETGWPSIDPRLWPIAHKELLEAISEQVDYEIEIRGLAAGWGDISRYGFNLSQITLGERLKVILDNKFASNPNKDEKVKVCDIGGGDGSLLINSTLPYRARKSIQGTQLETTMTTLLDYGIRYSGWTAVDRMVETSVELPPADFYQAFDVITAQNSIYFWSRYPELATLNVSKMLRPGGIFLATLPRKAFSTKNNSSFEQLSYLESNPYLGVTDISPDSMRNGYIVEMKKLGH